MSARKSTLTTALAPLFTRAGSERTLEEFKNLLEREKLSDEQLRCLLFGCAKMGVNISPMGPPLTPDKISLQAIASALLATRSLRETYPISEDTEPTINICEQEARSLCIHFEGLKRDSRKEDTRPSRDEILADWLWVISSSHHFQGNTQYRLANSLILSGIEGFAQLPAKPEQVDALFKKRFNISALDFFALQFAMWASVTQKIFIETQALLKHSAKAPVLAPVLDSMLEELSFRSDQPLHHGKLAFAKNFSGKALAEAIFSRVPFIQVGSRRFMSSSHAYVRIQLTNKFLTRAMSYARADEGRGRADTAFSQLVGQRFELFVRELCGLLGPRYTHAGDFEYGSRSEPKRAPDHVLVERDKNKTVATIIECKGKMFREETTAGETLHSFRNEVKGSFSESIAQGIQFVYDCFNAMEDESLNPADLLIVDQLRAADRIILLGLFPDLPSAFSFKSFRDLLIEAVEARLPTDVWAWFVSKFEGRWHWHIMDLEDFELFVSLPERKRHLNRELRRYITRSTIDREAIPQAGKLPIDFRSFLIMNLFPRGAGGDCEVSALRSLHSVFELVPEHARTVLGLTE